MQTIDGVFQIIKMAALEMMIDTPYINNFKMHQTG
jgi:hypothetical protein